MDKELTISPENLTVANTYLALGDIQAASEELRVSKNLITEILNKGEVKRYIDAVYLDTGYRNRFKLANILDEVIDAKLEELRDSEATSKKDIADLIALSHKMRQDEMKAETERAKTAAGPAKTNINITPFEGNYGSLMKSLMIEGESVVVEENEST